MYSDDSLCRSTKRGITRQNAKEPLLTSCTMAVNSYGNRLAAEVDRLVSLRGCLPRWFHSAGRAMEMHKLARARSSKEKASCDLGIEEVRIEESGIKCRKFWLSWSGEGPPFLSCTHVQSPNPAAANTFAWWDGGY